MGDVGKATYQRGAGTYWSTWCAGIAATGALCSKSVMTAAGNHVAYCERHEDAGEAGEFAEEHRQLLSYILGHVSAGRVKDPHAENEGPEHRCTKACPWETWAVREWSRVLRLVPALEEMADALEAAGN